MEVRPIDGNILRKWCEKIIDQACHPATVQIGEVFLEKVRSMPTLTLPNEWVSVEERLPQKDGWYLVYAPGYWGNSKIFGLDGFAYSNFKHNYKVHWGIERGAGRGWLGIVTHWMPLPAPPGKEG